ncbi:uncharacterized protein DS421_9g260580 [Arachis hypogaea]|nr:uncharacterized protein DS421_9g260580 [Arachis hypogaea]
MHTSCAYCLICLLVNYMVRDYNRLFVIIVIRVTCGLPVFPFFCLFVYATHRRWRNGGMVEKFSVQVKFS